jgi:hypothetical protein
MFRASFFAWTPLLMAAAALGQTAPPESPTTQAMLVEVRQLRQDLQNVAATIQRVQIVVFRLQVQTTLLNRATERFENTRANCGQTQERRKYEAAELEQAQARLRAAQPPGEQKVTESQINQLKASVEMLATSEQECRTNEIDAQAQLRIEQSKMDDLQSQLDRLDRVLAAFRGQ